MKKVIVAIIPPIFLWSNLVYACPNLHTTSLRGLAFAERPKKRTSLQMKESIEKIIKYTVKELFNVKSDIAESEAFALKERIRDMLNLLTALELDEDAAHAFKELRKITLVVLGIKESIQSCNNVFPGFEVEYQEIVASYNKLYQTLLQTTRILKRRIEAKGYEELRMAKHLVSTTFEPSSERSEQIPVVYAPLCDDIPGPAKDLASGI